MSRVAEIVLGVKNTDTIKYTNSSAVNAGDVVYVEGLGALVAYDDYDASAEGVYYKKARITVDITSGVTISQGNRVYFDASAETVQLESSAALTSSDFYLGIAVADGTAAGGYVDVDINEGAIVEGKIAVYGNEGNLKGSYSTIDLAVAALANDDILVIKSGSYTLAGACNITKTGVSIIGDGIVNITAAAAADYAFKTVLGAISSTKSVTFKNLNIDHGDDATQDGISIENTSATGRINATISDCEFESDGGNSIEVPHAGTAAVRLRVNDCTLEGPLSFTVKSTDDQCRLVGTRLMAGLVTSADNIAMEISLRDCLVLHEGITGGHASQLLYAMGCFSETDANPNVYAALDTNDLAGSHTESLLFPAS
jgi:predicted RecA/RadA family phage recombinase